MKLKSFIFASAILILVSISSTGVLASGSSKLVSNGRVVYTNGTPNNPSDDIIIYDSDDLVTLENNIKFLEAELTAAKNKLQ